MDISVGYGFWRGLRIVLVGVLLSLLYAAILLLASLFAAPYLIPIAFGGFVLLLFIGVIALGSPDASLAKWHEAQLLSSRELYSTLYSQSPVPYLTLDKKGRITTSNQAAARLLGILQNELVGQSLVERFSHDDDVHYSVVLGKLGSGVAVTGEELLLTTFTAEQRWVSVSIFTNETFGQRLVSLIDITQHKIVDKAKSEFVALATHQLRTPIAAIRWNVELLERSLRSTATEKQQNYLVKVDRNVRRMLALINDFLSVSKLETGTFSATTESFELASYLRGIIEEYEAQIQEKQLQVVTSFTPNPCTYAADTRLFHVIASNLVSNAVKYTPAGGTVTLSYAVTAGQLILTVRDTGIGIPAEQLPRLFTKFFRASNAVQHRAEGTGLGLYIVQESATQLGGTVTVQSTENAGTTFTVTLPVA